MSDFAHDIIVRTVNGSIHRIHNSTVDALPTQTMISWLRSKEFHFDANDAYVITAHIVEVWEVPAGAHPYTGRND